MDNVDIRFKSIIKNVDIKENEIDVHIIPDGLECNVNDILKNNVYAAINSIREGEFQVSFPYYGKLDYDKNDNTLIIHCNDEDTLNKSEDEIKHIISSNIQIIDAATKNNDDSVKNFIKFICSYHDQKYNPPKSEDNNYNKDVKNNDIFDAIKIVSVPIY